MQRILPLLCLLAALLVPAAAAWAEEVFILDNGNVVRGRVVREDKDQVVVRLSGFAQENRITLQPAEIVRRFVSVDPNHKPGSRSKEVDEITLAYRSEAPRDGVPKTVLLAPGVAGRESQPLPRGEVSMESEDFFSRLGCVAVAATPSNLEGRILLGILLFIVMTVLVAGGTRLLGMKSASLHASSSLGLLLGVFIVTDFLWSGAMLRADRALWVLPLQVLIWLGVARSTLDAPLSHTIPLFAIVLFASTCFVFATGSLLVSV